MGINGFLRRLKHYRDNFLFTKGWMYPVDGVSERSESRLIIFQFVYSCSDTLLLGYFSKKLQLLSILSNRSMLGWMSGDLIECYKMMISDSFICQCFLASFF